MSTTTTIQAIQPSLKIFILLLVACIAIPLLTHGLLPLIGVDFLQNLLSTKRIYLLCLAVLCGPFYLLLLRFLTEKPVLILIYIIVGWRILYFVNHILDAIGAHIPLRVLNFAVFGIPAGIFFLTRLSAIWRQLSFFKYILLFLSVFTVYFILYNHDFSPPTSETAAFTNISRDYFFDYFYSVLVVVVAGSCFVKTRGSGYHGQIFNLLNIALVGFSTFESVLTILGYPVGLLTRLVDGFVRSIGFLDHPNVYGQTQSVLTLYFLGLFFYYERVVPPNKQLLIKSSLIVAIIFNALGMLLSLSKDAYLGFGVALVIFIPYIVSVIENKLLLVAQIILSAVLIVVAYFVFQSVSGIDFTEYLMSRFSDQGSLTWRFKVWNFLMSDLNEQTLLFGHGLSAASMDLYRYLFDTRLANRIVQQEQSVLPHNASLLFLYDMGVFGLLIFCSYLSVLVQSVKMSFQRSPEAVLYTVAASLTVFYLVVAHIDECITAYPLNITYWLIITAIFGFSQRCREERIHEC